MDESDESTDPGTVFSMGPLLSPYRKRVAFPLEIANSKDEILAWVGQQFCGGEPPEMWGPGCKVFECSHGDNHAIVLLIDMGSGVWLDHIFIFGRSGETGEWRFVLYCPTLIEVKVYREKDNLVFKTITDDVILIQPLDTIGEVRQIIYDKMRQDPRYGKRRYSL